MTQSKKPIVKPLRLDGIAAQADGLSEQAQAVKAEQTAMLEATPLESKYGAAFAALVEAKYGQAERIEDRLENLISQQTSRLQHTQTGQSGLFIRLGAQASQNQVKQQRIIQRLHDRLEAVREIKEGMGVHDPRIEELATRKLRAREPGLTREWEDMCEAHRLHQAMLRRQEQEKRRALEVEQHVHLGMGIHRKLPKLK
jgi:uncharacterized protein YdiU (UPF0061 family)